MTQPDGAPPARPPPQQHAGLAAPAPHAARPDEPLPVRKLSWGTIGLGVTGVVGGAALSFLTPWIGIPYFTLGAVLLGKEVYSSTVTAGSQALAGSFHCIALGRLGRAERLLDHAEKAPLSWVLRIADIQRAVIHIRRGDMAKARDRLDSAIARPLGRMARANSVYQIEGAMALRAFARATLDDRDGARSDIDAVRARPGATAEALARVALAEAILIERVGERSALRDHIEKHKGLLLESCHPRERAIVRAYQRMLKVTATTVYRQSGEREPAARATEEPMLADWVEKIAPAAAPFVRVARNKAGDTPAAALPRPNHATDRARRAVLASRYAATQATKPRRRFPKVLEWGAILAVAIVAVFVIQGYLSWSAGASSRQIINEFGTAADSPPDTSSWWPYLAGLAATIASVFGYYVLRGRFRSRPRIELVRLAAARAALGRGELDVARTAIHGSGSASPGQDPQVGQDLTQSDHDLVAANAHLLEAILAERQGEVNLALAACDAGIGRLTRARAGGAGAHAILPELIAQRALALAMSDRFEEAAAELSSLGTSSYPFKARDVFRVRLVELARRGMLDEAAELVENGALDLPLNVREELLADLVRAIAAPHAAGLGELARLKDELKSSPENKLWIDVVAPGLIDRFARATEIEDENDEPRARIVAAASAAPRRAASTRASHDRAAKAEPVPAGQSVQRKANPTTLDDDLDAVLDADLEAEAEADRPAPHYRRV